MERVETLVSKLQDQLAKQATAAQILVTARMLVSELQHLEAGSPSANGSVSVHIASFPSSAKPEIPEIKPPAPEERTVEVLQVDEAAMEAELDEIKRNAQTLSNISAHNKPAMQFDPVEDIPTLTHQQPAQVTAPQKEVHETISKGQDSLNDRLRTERIELSDTLKDAPIRDLKKAIGINDRFLFVRELFRGDETMYERSIKTINGFSILPEAEYWIRRELKLKLAWNDQDEAVRQFDQLIKRRFS